MISYFVAFSFLFFVFVQLIEAIELEMNVHNLQITQTSIDKVIELYEISHSHHSVMLVGKTLSGKTTTWKLLKYALTTLNKRGFSEFNKIIVSNFVDFLCRHFVFRIRSIFNLGISN